MPQARKSTRSSSRRSSTRSSSRSATSFKEPAALKRLNKSIGDAEKALKELRSSAGARAPKSTQGLYKGVGKFLTSARRDSGKFATALKKDFDQALKAAERARSSSTGTSRSRSRTSSTSKSGGSRRTTTKRSTRK